MRDADEATVREFETWLSAARGEPLPEEERWRAWFCIAEWERPEFESLSRTLLDAAGSGSFAFLGRDAEDHAGIIADLHDAGHEIAVHSHRHHGYGDLSYEAAHGALSAALDAIEAAAGVRPRGFFAPLLDLSEGAVRAVEDLGFEWVLGRPAVESGGAVEFLEPVTPLDVRAIPDAGPGGAMERFREAAEAGEGPFLFHPPVVGYLDAMDAFEGWIEAVGPTSVADQLADGGPGVVLDCVRPVRVE